MYLELVMMNNEFQNTFNNIYSWEKILGITVTNGLSVTDDVHCVVTNCVTLCVESLACPWHVWFYSANHLLIGHHCQATVRIQCLAVFTKAWQMHPTDTESTVSCAIASPVSTVHPFFLHSKSSIRLFDLIQSCTHHLLYIFLPQTTVASPKL